MCVCHWVYNVIMYVCMCVCAPVCVRVWRVCGCVVWIGVHVCHCLYEQVRGNWHKGLVTSHYQHLAQYSVKQNQCLHSVVGHHYLPNTFPSSFQHTQIHREPTCQHACILLTCVATDSALCLIALSVSSCSESCPYWSKANCDAGMEMTVILYLWRRNI